MSSFYQKEVILTKSQWEIHIEPNKKNLTPEKIGAVIAGHDAIYQDKSVSTRHMVFNSRVVSPSGKPLTVVVDVIPDEKPNEIVTAFYNRKPNHGPLVWESEPEALRSSYDQGHDVFHLTLVDFKSSEDEEVEDGVFFGFDEDGDQPAAAMIFRFHARSAPELRGIAARIAEAMHVTINAVERAFSSF